MFGCSLRQRNGNAKSTQLTITTTTVVNTIRLIKEMNIIEIVNHENVLFRRSLRLRFFILLSALAPRQIVR